MQHSGWVTRAERRVPACAAVEGVHSLSQDSTAANDGLSQQNDAAQQIVILEPSERPVQALLGVGDHHGHSSWMDIQLVVLQCSLVEPSHRQPAIPLCPSAWQGELDKYTGWTLRKPKGEDQHALDFYHPAKDPSADGNRAL